MAPASGSSTAAAGGPRRGAAARGTTWPRSTPTGRGAGRAATGSRRCRPTSPATRTPSPPWRAWPSSGRAWPARSDRAGRHAGSNRGGGCVGRGAYGPRMLTLRTCSLRRYRVEGTLPAPLSEEFARRLTDRRFLPLSAREERAYGWVTADNLLLTQFDADTLVRGEHVVLGLRIDRRRVNGRLLRAQLDLEVRARTRAADDGAGSRRLGREERLELRQHLQQELLRQTSPSVD